MSPLSRKLCQPRIQGSSAQATGGITPRTGVDFLRLLPCCCCCCCCRLRFSVTLCKCVLANPVKIAFGTCQHCVASQKSQNPKTKNTQKKIGKTTNTTAPAPPPPVPFPFSYTLSFHFLQRDFYYTLRFRFVSSRLVQFSYIYFACNSFPFIFTCIYRQTVPRICVWDSVLGFSDFTLCCCFYFFPFTVRRCFLFYVCRSCFFVGLALDLDSVLGLGLGRESALTVNALHL